MSDPAIHKNLSTGVLPDEQDLGFDYFFNFISFLNEASDDDFKIHVESDPSAPTISMGLHRCHPYLDIGTLEE